MSTAKSTRLALAELAAAARVLSVTEDVRLLFRADQFETVAWSTGGFALKVGNRLLARDEVEAVLAIARQAEATCGSTVTIDGTCVIRPYPSATTIEFFEEEGSDGC